jgi:glucosamine kinase
VTLNEEHAALLATRPVVGLDVGGSKTHLAVGRDPTPAPGTYHERIVPSASWHRTGLEGVAAGIVELLGEELDEAPGAVAVGAHGCDNRSQCHRLEKLLTEELRVPVLVVNDAELLLPAAGLAHGVAVIAGTGSIALGYDKWGEMLVAGGWGGYLGDEGSATGLFRDAARKVASAYDRGDDEDPLAPVLTDVLGIDDLRDLPRALSSFSTPTAWAKHTPEVFDRALGGGSQLAPEVVEESAQALVDLVLLLAARGADAGVVVAAGGVIANAEWMQAALRRRLAGSCPDSTLILLSLPPVAGALNLARALLALTRGDVPEGPLHPVLSTYLSQSTVSQPTVSRSTTD